MEPFLQSPLTLLTKYLLLSVAALIAASHCGGKHGAMQGQGGVDGKKRNISCILQKLTIANESATPGFCSDFCLFEVLPHALNQ